MIIIIENSKVVGAFFFFFNKKTLPKTAPSVVSEHLGVSAKVISSKELAFVFESQPLCASVFPHHRETGGTHKPSWAEPLIQSTKDEGSACVLLHIKAGHDGKKSTLLLFMTYKTS